MSNRNRNGPGPIPKRWLHCPARFDHLILNKFVTFKTPLSDKFDSQVGNNCFYPSMLFSLMDDIYKKKIGLWIDLTNTSRFYDKNDVEKKHCRYKKLQCRGHGETPSIEQTQAFIEIVDEFTSMNPVDCIAVHCTHGFNRTGFLIVSYLVEKHDFGVSAAIQSFANARPPGIYKQDYINELYKRYDDEDDATPAPGLPGWCFEGEDETDDYGSQDPTEASSSRRRKSEDRDEYDENDGVEAENGEDGEPSKKKRKRENIRLDAVFMDGVPGVTLMTNKTEVNALQEIVQNMCHWEKTGFPGAQPVSMNRTNIQMLHTKPYKVSWKADGTRYMMLIHKEGEIYFFDRDNSCFKVDGLKFPQTNDLTKHIKNTLLDGEMVIDKVKGRSFPRYLAYDIIRFENDDLTKKSFDDRLNVIRSLIVGPRHEAMRRGIIIRDREPFSVRVKDFWSVTQAEALLGPKFAQQLSHEPDGLIFQPKLEPYVGGRCDDILKWKPAELNSVDFQMKIVAENGIGLLARKRAFLYVGGMTTPFGEIKYKKDFKEMNNKIVECKFDRENSGWSFMRERTDKSFPNAYSTAVAVCESIKKPVTKEILLDYIAHHRFKDDSESMPPPHR